MASKVYFSREISAQKVLDMYKLLGKALPGKVAVPSVPALLPRSTSNL